MENQRLPGDTSYSDSQAAHSEPQTTSPGTKDVYSDFQTAYSKPQAAHPDTQLAYSKTEDAYGESQGSFSETEDAYEEPQLAYADLYPDSAGYAGTGSASFPIQNQPGCSLSDETGEALGMPEPSRSLDCPPGLECLSQMNEMLILQDIRLLDVFANFLTKNKYQMRNSLGQTVLFAVEDSEWYSRITCGTYRPFTLRIFNNMDQEVITLERPLRCSKCCFPWFLQELKVQAPPGVPIGYVMQIWHPRLPMFIIQNAKRKNVLNITGPCSTWNCCKAVDFEIKSVDEDSVVGKISKQSSGFVKEFFINAGNIEIQFPKDLSGTMKAVVLGACFLIGIYVIYIMSSYDMKPTIQWMYTPRTTSNCPPGLEYLAQINQLVVCQRFDMEELGHWEISKTYEVMNNQGHRIYFAEEKNNWFLQKICGTVRPFTMTIYDNVGQDVITIHKALRCSSCLSSCCLQKLKVEAPPGKKIGYVYQYFHPFLPKFKIKNENKEDVMKIRGPCLISSCVRNLNFNLLSLDEEMVIGNISKQSTGFVKGLLTDTGKFGIQFPYDLDVKIKALMLGASFLIDYMYYEICP